MTVPCQFVYENIMYARKNVSNYIKSSDRHNFNTRAKDKIVQPHFRLSKINNSFMSLCIRYYNKLPDNIVNLTETKFKSCIKRTLCMKAYYKLDDYVNDKSAWDTAFLTKDL